MRRHISFFGLLVLLLSPGLAFADAQVSAWHDGWILGREYSFSTLRSAQSAETGGGGNFNGDRDTDGSSVIATCNTVEGHYELSRGFIAMPLSSFIPEGHQIVAAELYLKPQSVTGTGWTVTFSDASTDIETSESFAFDQYGNVDLDGSGYFSSVSAALLTADQYVSVSASTGAIADMNASEFLQLAVRTSYDTGNTACDMTKSVSFYGHGADPGISDPYVVLHFNE